MDYYKQFKKHLSNNDYPSFLNLWEEYCESDEIDGLELKEILLAAKEAKISSSFGLYGKKSMMSSFLVRLLPLFLISKLPILPNLLQKRSNIYRRAFPMIKTLRIS